MRGTYSGTHVEVLQFIQRNRGNMRNVQRSGKGDVHTVWYDQVKTHRLTQANADSPVITTEIILY